jgi:hypothetical protein
MIVGPGNKATTNISLAPTGKVESIIIARAHTPAIKVWCSLKSRYSEARIACCYVLVVEVNGSIMSI